MTRNNPSADTDRDIFHIRHDWESSERLSHRIITAVAAINGTEPAALPLLARTCDTDSLNGLFADRTAGRSIDRCSFTFAGCRVCIHRNGHVVLRSLARD